MVSDDGIIRQKWLRRSFAFAITFLRRWMEGVTLSCGHYYRSFIMVNVTHWNYAICEFCACELKVNWHNPHINHDQHFETRNSFCLIQRIALSAFSVPWSKRALLIHSLLSPSLSSRCSHFLSNRDICLLCILDPHRPHPSRAHSLTVIYHQRHDDNVASSRGAIATSLIQLLLNISILLV